MPGFRRGGPQDAVGTLRGRPGRGKSPARKSPSGSAPAKPPTSGRPHGAAPTIRQSFCEGVLGVVRGGHPCRQLLGGDRPVTLVEPLVEELQGDLVAGSEASRDPAALAEAV